MFAFRVLTLISSLVWIVYCLFWFYAKYERWGTKFILSPGTALLFANVLLCAFVAYRIAEVII